MFQFLFFRKSDLIKIVTDASFTSTSKVWTSAILEWLQLRH
jgi:hypothetical protein